MFPIHKILIPIDLSEPSLAALDRAGQLALDCYTELIGVHVLAINTIAAPEMPAVPYDFDEQRIEQVLREIYDAVVPRLPAGVRFRAIVKVGYPADEILCAAHEERCDLICMSTHGRTGWRHLVIGSVAEEVVRRSPCPVLAVRQRTDGDRGANNFKSILCPTDFSEPSVTALREAGDLALRLRAELHVLHVVEPVQATDAIIDREEFEQALEWDASHALLRLIEDNVPADIVENAKLHREIRRGRAAHGIVELAREEAVDLIVIATHGRTGWRHLVFGSVAEEVVRIAPCAVLTVHVGPGDACQSQLPTCKTAAVP